MSPRDNNTIPTLINTKAIALVKVRTIYLPWKNERCRNSDKCPVSSLPRAVRATSRGERSFRGQGVPPERQSR